LTRRSLREALAAERPLVTPLAHDALSAALTEQAGFKAFAIGGSALLAARHALPDIGLIGLRDMTEAIRDIAAASTLPFLADGDDGYGDVKSVVRTVLAYEELGVGGILIEDQLRDRKQQRADKAAAVVAETIIEGKLRAALAARRHADTLIIGRTDAFGALGMDAALRRAERFLKIGVDGVFVAGLRTTEDYERVGGALAGAVLSAAIFEGSGTPWITPQQLGALGFRHVSFPVTVLFRCVAAIRNALLDLRRYAEGGAAMSPMPDAASAREILDAAIGLAGWQQIETAYPEETSA
jgi:2-methylisocitrate lyase-like PEP mutase family enzyme